MNIEIKNVGYGSLAAIIGALLMLGGVEITDEDVYGCEDRMIAMPCEDLTPYYGLPNGKCINQELGNKLCRSGWTDDIRDFKAVEEISPDTSQVYVNANNKDWICDTDDGVVNSYSKCRSNQFSGYLGELI